MDDPSPDPDCPGCQALLKRLAAVEARVRELEARLNRNSSNSNKPPSSDPPGMNRAARRAAEREQRKRGGQPGHPKASRPLLPPDEVHQRVPKECERCGEALSGKDRAPNRHQVTEIPPIKVQVTEYQLHALSCRCCGHTTRAKLDKGVPRGAFGPRLQSFVVTLTGAFRMSRRNARDLMHTAFGVDLSLGAISKIEGSVSTALAPYHAEAMERVRTARHAHTDETGWMERHERAWLWASATDRATVFLIRKSRCSQVAKEILGPDFGGTSVTDRFSSYQWLNPEQHQVCWAHLLRDFRGIAESGSAALTVGECLEDAAHALFSAWHRLRDGALTRVGFQRHARRLRRRIRGLLEAGTLCKSAHAQSVCRGILRVEDTLWTFIDVEGVEPTNNIAEQALRTGVIWRKTSYGTQSERGSRFVERMLTCSANLRKHARSLFDFVTDVISAALHGRSRPVLFSQ
jgi:transposase